MRIHWVGIFLLACTACSGSEAPDAGPVDATVTMDAAMGTLACGDLFCEGTQEFCREQAKGECMPLDGGSCPEEFEACNLPLGAGCVVPPERSCAALSSGCDNCVCIIDQQPCGPGLASVTCSADDDGLTVRCPP